MTVGLILRRRWAAPTLNRNTADYTMQDVRLTIGQVETLFTALHPEAIDSMKLHGFSILKMKSFSRGDQQISMPWQF